MRSSEDVTEPRRRSGWKEGATVGLLAGISSGGLGELLLLLVRQAFPTDVAIVGFVLVWAVPLGLVVGVMTTVFSIWPANGRSRFLVSAIPGGLAALVVVAMPLSAV